MARLGGVHSAKCLMLSVDFAEIEEQQPPGAVGGSGAGDGRSGTGLGTRRRGLCGGSATNTMHKMPMKFSTAATSRYLHIADAAAVEIQKQGTGHRVGLLGTRFTHGGPFYKERLAEKFGT